MKYISRKDHLRFLTSSISVFQMLCIFRGKWRRAWVNRRAPGFLPQISGPLGNDRHALADHSCFDNGFRGTYGPIPARYGIPQAFSPPRNCQVQTGHPRQGDIRCGHNKTLRWTGAKLARQILLNVSVAWEYPSFLCLDIHSTSSQESVHLQFGGFVTRQRLRAAQLHNSIINDTPISSHSSDVLLHLNICIYSLYRPHPRRSSGAFRNFPLLLRQTFHS